MSSTALKPETPEAVKASITFVFLVVLIDMIGFGIIMPVLPELITQITGDSLSAAAVDAGWLAFAYAIMQFFFGPVIGNLSDRYGRRPVLLGALGGYSIAYALMGFAPSLLWLFVARIVAGIMGASFSTAYAYVADVSPPEKRSQNFGLIGAAFGLGFIIGPAMGGLLGEYHVRLPFFAASALAAINLIFGFFMLRESLPEEKRRKFQMARANAFVALKGLSGQNRVVLWYAGALLVWMIGHIVYPIIFAFYAIEAFGWSAFTVGMALALVGVGAALVQGLLIRYLIPRIGERKAVIIAAFSMAISTIAYVIAGPEQGWMIFLAIPIGAMQGLFQPSLNGLMSKAVSDETQGELQGAVASLQSLGSVIGPPMFTAVFAAFTVANAPYYLPGAPFGLAGLIALIALAIFLRGYALHCHSSGVEPPPDAKPAIG
ncbi:MAG: TCR/Tet family MFS transporter [Sphingomonadales bacterium]|nr:TCR/Tet family MFS transporter [Sphingomonadales bacterium]PIX67182.1 MAG: tetracycline resistance MFS efflux pump [Sphingomonadales bacterium CG_4_10_14_3_um_filter_58_15]NCO50110.1 TCR/Tet family MFS transporter [Sphingomonadales bacterium]NCO99545.1 TCR/Tet family MFS transporter [Sphingomonadales bacterium]NCP27673.1 TCR/Tet family MFS transporter [Sphingomonadales bacterium]